ncbi:hypothetical protein H5410_038008 [Solanum commersonii]|uniref:Cell differentiation protein rcd1 n=1 Tax=Solanum commersonii TaxID=4109 RepID=A0A9J5YB39_SOLCO|nr:hypothetical protein H5410_038008 [Solanum commersonii]
MEKVPESPFSESTLKSLPSQKNPNYLSALTPNQLVLLIHDASLREEVMHHLCKKKDSCRDLALLLWNNFNTVYMLLLEVTSVYRKFSPSMLSMREATRVCCALALFQPCEDHDEPLEQVRITTLGVLGDLTKFDDPYGSHALHLFLESEVVPLCLKCMDACDEMSWKLATLIVMKILTQERGLTYCCATPERFFAIVQHDCEASWMLQMLHLNIYGCLYFPPIEERKKIAKKVASSYASSSKGKGKGKKSEPLTPEIAAEETEAPV